MQHKQSDRKTSRNITQNSRALARGGKYPMAATVERRRVWVLVDLKRKSKYRNEVLSLLADTPAGIASVQSLYLRTGYSNITTFKRSVLQRLHDDELVYFDKVTKTVKLTRLGWLVARHAKL